MTIPRALIAAMTVGVLAVVAILVFGPRHEPTALGGSTPHPIAGPAIPSTWPYSQLAVLRQQRLSTDVLPASFTADDETIIRASARHLATDGHQQLWLVVDGAQDLCLLFLEDGVGGATTACASPPDHVVAPGTLTLGAGAGDYELHIYADGAVKRTGEDAPTGRRIAYNVWLDGVKHPSRLTGLRAPSAGPDAQSFPLTYPYSTYAILRQEPVPLAKLPAIFTEDSGGFLDSIDQTTVHYAGEYEGAEAWVAVNTVGEVCLISKGQDDSLGLGCDDDRETGRGVFVSGFGNGGVTTQLVTDGKVSTDDVEGATRIAPNVWAAALD